MTAWTGWSSSLTAFVTGSEWFSLIGGLLELLGLCFVAGGIDKKQREAGKPGIWASLREAGRRILVRIGILKPRAQTLDVQSATSEHSVGFPRPKVVTDRTGSHTKRIERLERLLDEQDRRMDDLEDSLEDERKARTKSDDEERRARESALEGLRTSLKDFAAGDLVTESAGLALFLFGVALQTWGSIAV